VSAVLFLAGVWVSVRTITAAHRIHDLWAVPGASRGRTALGLLLWAGAAAAGWGLPAFRWGLLAFAAFYPMAWTLGVLALELMARRR